MASSKNLKNLLAAVLAAGLLLPSFSPLFAQELGERQALQELQREWQEIDRNTDDCKPTKPGLGSGLFGNNLRSVITRGIQKNLSQTIGNTVTNNLQKIVQRQVRQSLSRVIHQGLSRQLPNLLKQKMRDGGVDTPDTSMVRESVRELLPQIIRRDLSGALEEDMRGALRQDLSQQFEKLLIDSSDPAHPTSPLLQGDQGFQNLLLTSFGPGSELAQLFGPEAIINIIETLIDENIDDILDGEVPSPKTLASQARTIILQRLAASLQLIMANLAASVENGIANEAGRGVGQSGGTDRLVEQMMPVIMQVVLNGVPGASGSGIMSQLTDNNLSGAVQQADNSFNDFDFSSWAGNNITAAIGFDLRPISEAIAEPLALATVSGVGISGYEDAITNLSAIGYRGPVTPEVIGWGNDLETDGTNYLAVLGPHAPPLSAEVINQANSGVLQPAVSLAPLPTYNDILSENYDSWRLANPDFVGPPSPADILGGDAAAAVSGHAVATGVSQGWSGLGGQISADLKAGLIGGISGGIGNLVDGVPYVGGLLSPIAERVVETALVAALAPIGAVAPITGIPVHDLLLEGAVKDNAKTISTVGKATIKALSKPLNKMEALDEQNSKQNQEIIKNQQEQETIATQTCMKNKGTMKVVRAIETLFRITYPAAHAGSILLYEAVTKDWQVFKQDAVRDRLNPENQQGGPIYADIAENTDKAREEGLRETIYDASQSPNEYQRDEVEKLNQLARAGAWDRQTLPKSERDQLMADPNLLTNEEFRDGLRKAFKPSNDPRGIALKSWDDAQANIAKKENQEIAKHIANEGYNPLEDCLEIVSIPFGGYHCRKWKVATPGAVLAAQDKAIATFFTDKLANANQFKEDALGTLASWWARYVSNASVSPEELEPLDPNPCPGLEPCDPKTGYRGQSAYIRPNFGLYQNLSFNVNFEAGLNDVFQNTSNGLSDLLGGQVDQFSNNLMSGLDNAGFTSNDFTDDSRRFQTDNRLANVIGEAIAAINQDGGIIAEQELEIINILLPIIFALIVDLIL